MSIPKGSLSVEVFRFNPKSDKEPHFDAFELAYQEGRSIQDILMEIYEKHDPSLAFYNSCRIGKCTGCHLRVNGKTVLACTEVASQSTYRIEPMPGYEVVRDLVVNRTQEAIQSKKAARKKDK